MDDPRSVIERSLTRVGSESYTLESFYRKRDRKRARQRLTAGVAGLAIVIAIVVAGSTILRSAPEDEDVGRKGAQILRNGEVLQVGDEYGPRATLVATDYATGHQRILQRCGGYCGGITEFALSAGGGWIAWEERCGGGCQTTGSSLWVGGADGSTIQLTPSVPSPGRYPLWSQIWAWSTATEQLAFVTERPGLAELVFFDPAKGERASVTTVDEISALSWSPDGTAIAIASPSSGVSIIDLTTGRSNSIARRIGTVDDLDLSWSPDGTRLVLATFDQIIVLNADGSDRRVLDANAYGLGAPAWSPDGTRIAFFGTSGSGRRFSVEVRVIAADGSGATRVFHVECCPHDGSGPVWSPDGSRIAFFDDAHVPSGSFLAVNADGSGSPELVDDVVVDGWIQG